MIMRSHAKLCFFLVYMLSHTKPHSSHFYVLLNSCQPACSRVRSSYRTIIISNTFERSSNVSRWWNGEDARFVKQSVLVQILYLAF